MPPLAAVPDLDRELDELYSRPLEEFTQARNDLAARLRKAHQSEAAAEVRALRKPSVVAWTANRLARTEPDLVSRLIEATAGLRDSQQQALGGRGSAGDVGDATEREREAVRALVVAARTELGPRANANLLDRLTQTLRAAAMDVNAAKALRTGRLTEEMQAIGFGPLEAVAPKRRRETDEVRRAARERVDALRAEARRLTSEVRDGERDIEETERALQELREEIDAKREEAERVATELAEAEEDLRARR